MLLLVLQGAGAQDLFSSANRALEEGRRSEARSLYETWLGQHPDDAFARYNLSLCLEDPVEQLARCLELDPTRAYGLVRPPGGEALEVRPVNLLRLRAGTRLALARKSWPLALATGDWELSGDPELALARARLAPPGLAVHLYQEYLEQALVSTGRTDQVAVWGPGSQRSFSLSVDREGRVTPLGARLPAQSYNLTVTPEGYLRCWSLLHTVPLTVARVRLEDPASRLLQGFTQAHGETGAAWEELRALGGLEVVAASPFLAPEERQAGLRRLAGDRGWECYALLRLARLGLDDVKLRRPSLEHVRRVLEAFPDFDEAIYLAAALELLEGQAPLAESRLLALAALEPPRAQPWRLLVRMQAARGNLPRALELAGRYRERFPRDPHPAYLEAELLSRLERREEALERLRPWEHLVEPLYLQARLAGRSGQVARQRELLERLLGLDPWPYRAERMLAALCERLGENERALELYKRYLRSIEAAVYERSEYAEAGQRFRILTTP